MADKEYIIFCDESEKTGRYYSNFYGGLVVGSSHYERVTRRLTDLKQQLNLFGEVKWDKVTERYLEKYQTLMMTFFEELAAANIRVRIMFRQNARVPYGLTTEQREMEYFLFYYQFIKHGLGLAQMDANQEETRLRVYLDRMPDSQEKIEQFKGFLLGLPKSAEFREVNITLAREDVTEVRSHDHVLLQCLDIVLGAMAFRLNDKHKDRPPGQRLRGKRTIAKEKLYKYILALIRKIRRGFNPGISTGIDGDIRNRWKQPYSHWLFVPSNARYEASLTKRGKK